MLVTWAMAHRYSGALPERLYIGRIPSVVIAFKLCHPSFGLSQITKLPQCNIAILSQTLAHHQSRITFARSLWNDGVYHFSVSRPLVRDTNDKLSDFPSASLSSPPSNHLSRSLYLRIHRFPPSPISFSCSAASTLPGFSSERSQRIAIGSGCAISPSLESWL